MVSQKNNSNIFLKSFRDYYRNPYVILPSLVLLLLIIIFTEISIKMNYLLETTLTLTSWVVFFSLVFILFASYFLSGLIGLCVSIVSKKKYTFSTFIKNANKFFLKNFVIIIIIMIAFQAVRWPSHYLAFFIGQSLSLPQSQALALFVFLLILGLATIVTFLAFSSFYLISSNLSIFNSIKKSISFVTKNYPIVISIFIGLFVIQYFLEFLPTLLHELLAVLIFSYLALLMTRIIIEKR